MEEKKQDNEWEEFSACIHHREVGNPFLARIKELEIEEEKIEIMKAQLEKQIESGLL